MTLVDLQEALLWMKTAANADFANAQYGLALMYESGEGVEQNSSEYVRWLTRAAEDGHQEAQTDLERLKEMKS